MFTVKYNVKKIYIFDVTPSYSFDPDSWCGVDEIKRCIVLKTCCVRPLFNCFHCLSYDDRTLPDFSHCSKCSLCGVIFLKILCLRLRTNRGQIKLFFRVSQYKICALWWFDYWHTLESVKKSVEISVINAWNQKLLQLVLYVFALKLAKTSQPWIRSGSSGVL